MATKPVTTVDHCMKESELTQLKEQVKTLYNNQKDNKQDLKELTEVVMELKSEITKLNTTLSSFKWMTGIGISLFGGITLFLVIELIKIIH